MTVSPIAPPPQKGGCWKWGAIGCGAALVLLAIFAGVIAAIYFAATKSTGVYRGAREVAERDPRVIAILGSPVRAEWWVSGNWEVHNRRGNANLDFPIRGPKGHARVHVVATRDRSGWHYQELIVTPENGPEIDLLKP